MKRIFLVDFDGTITIEDTCFLMLKRFCRPGWQDINDQWEQGKIGTIECAQRTFKLLDVSPPDLLAYFKSVPIDPGFKDFADLVSQQGDKLYILSDGYDLNIQTILEQNGLEQVPFYANVLRHIAGEYHIECPYHNPACGQCGTCKTSLLEQLCEEEAQTIYVGDGTSDKCVVKFADIVFAKSGLLSYCQDNGLRANEFKSFQDIIDWLKKQIAY